MTFDDNIPVSEQLPATCATWQQAYSEASAHAEWKDASPYITHWDRRSWLPGPVRYAKAYITFSGTARG